MPLVGAALMSGLSRRSFLGASVAGLSALHGQAKALATMPENANGLSQRTNASHASALNLKLFLKNKGALGLTGLVNMKPVQGTLGSYAHATLFLFPFRRSASSPDFPAFLPSHNANEPLIASIAITPGGLPPDEYFCNYVLKAPPRSFIAFSVGAPFARGADRRPWHSNLDMIGNHSVGIGWTSSNLNHPWFAGCRWIPDRGEGRHWRARIADGLRRLSAIDGSEAVG